MAPKDSLTPGNPGTTPGEKFRNTINAALEDSRRQTIQYDIVNEFFTAMADKLEPIMARHTQEFFNRVARISAKSPEDANAHIIESVTVGEGGQPTFLRIGVPVNPLFLEFTAADIKEMPGYIALHEKARALDIALSLNGMTTEEGRGAGINAQPPVLTINMMQSYEDGAAGENSNLYPNLPPVPPTYDKRGARNHYVL